MKTLDLLNETGGMDRRQKKTRMAIEMALIELLGEKPLENVTITELAEKANINRKTFYNNFSSVQDVAQDIESKFIHLISTSLSETVRIENEIGVYKLFLKIAESMEEYKKLLRSLFFSKSAMNFKKSVQEIIFPYVERNLRNHQVDEVVVPYITSYILEGLFCIFADWTQGKDEVTPEQVALLAYNLTMSVLRSDNYKDFRQK